MKFKDLWDIESAMQVLSHDTVDSKLWADAVEWLIHNGPPGIQKLLIDASVTATNASFPDLKPSYIGKDGQPCYTLKELATSLEIKESEVETILKKKGVEINNNLFSVNEDDEPGTIH